MNDKFLILNDRAICFEAIEEIIRLKGGIKLCFKNGESYLVTYEVDVAKINSLMGWK